IHPSVRYVRLHLALEVRFDVLRERDVLEVAQLGIGLETHAATAGADGFGVLVTLREDRAKEFLFGRLPPAPALLEELPKLVPRRRPVQARVATQCFVDGLHVLEEMWAGIEEARLVVGCHLVPKPQRALHGD